MKKQVRQYSAEEKSKIVIETIKGELTIAQITSKYGVHATQISNWKKQGLELLVQGFKSKTQSADPNQQELIKNLYEQIEHWVKLQKRGKSELGVGIAVNFFSVIEKYPAISYLTQMPYPCRMIMFYAFIFWYI